MFKPKKPRLAVMLDQETLSTRKNAAVIDIAFIAIHIRNGITEFQEIEWQIDPASYEGYTNFAVDPSTIDFHKRQNTGLLEQCAATGQTWQAVSDEVTRYLSNLAVSYDLHIWSQGKDFDLPILENLLLQAGRNTVPWHHSKAHCLRDLSTLYPEVRRKSYGDHTALADSRAQVAQLLDIASYSERASNMIFGKEA